jgi:hypothetical protein
MKTLIRFSALAFIFLFNSCSDDSNDIDDQRPFTEKYEGKVVEWKINNLTYYWEVGPSHLEVGGSNGKVSTPYDTF